MIDVQIQQDGLSDLIKRCMALPGVFARARKSAMSSVGYNIKTDLKNEVRFLSKTNPHTDVMRTLHSTRGQTLADKYGKSYQSRVRWTNRRVKNKQGKKVWREGNAYIHGKFDSSRKSDHPGWVKQRKAAERAPFKRWADMVRYEVDDDDMLISIGLLRPKSNYFLWMSKQTGGWSTAITPKMRRMLWAIGFPIKKGRTSLNIPGRQWIGGVRKKWTSFGYAARFFEAKFWEGYDLYSTGQSFHFRKS